MKIFAIIIDSQPAFVTEVTIGISLSVAFLITVALYLFLTRRVHGRKARPTIGVTVSLIAVTLSLINMALATTMIGTDFQYYTSSLQTC